MPPCLPLSGWRFGVGLVAVVLPLRIMWMMQTQLRLEDNSAIHRDLAELRGTLQGLVESERAASRRQILSLGSALNRTREEAAKASRRAEAAEQAAAAPAERLRALDVELDELRLADTQQEAQVQQLRALLSQPRPAAGAAALRAAPPAAEAVGSTSTSSAYSPKSNDAQTPRPEAQSVDTGDDAEVDWVAPREGKCPENFPHPYKSDDRGFASHCCEVPLNCHGEAISATKEFECCGGEHKAISFTYHYTGPEDTDAQCEEYEWWKRLENVDEGPLWVPMKEHATIASKADSEALVKAGFKPSRITWAGKDPKLDGASAKVARGYVGSFWGVSGRRQFKTAMRYIGMGPDDKVLEVGCGALNAGQFFIEYLDVGNYFCVEPNDLLHNVSISESPSLQRNVSLKSPVFITRDDFDPRPVTGDTKFDRIWSHSVLSHAADWQLMQYFEVVADVLEDGGESMASMRFSDGRGSAMQASHDTSWIYPAVSYFDFAEARCMAKRVGLDLELVPEARLFMTDVVPAEMHDWVIMHHVANQLGPNG